MLGNMLKKFLLILTLLISIPVFAGEYEDAIKLSDKVLLYLYTPNCNYCNRFAPYYDKLSEIYSGKCKLLKIDATTRYGEELAKRFGIRFVPYVVLVEVKKDRGVVITPSCLVEYSCVNKVVDDMLR